MGSTTANSRRQDPKLRITPETAGPIAGATEMARVTLPITRPRSCSGTTCISVVISSGIITAVPDAWMMRAPSSTSNDGATVANAVPSRNKPIAVAYALRVDTRCRNHPVIGMTAAMVSMKAVESHCAVCSVMLQRAHQLRDRVDHDRLIEDDHERGEHQQPDHGRGAT